MRLCFKGPHYSGSEWKKPGCRSPKPKTARSPDVCEIRSTSLPRYCRCYTHRSNRLFFYGVDFPALKHSNISGDNAPQPLLHVLEDHSSLHNLHLRFEGWLLYGDRSADHMLLELLALILDESNGVFMDNLLRSSTESAEATCARRPHFEHLRVSNILNRSYVLASVQPLGRKLRCFDLQILSRGPVFGSVSSHS